MDKVTLYGLDKGGSFKVWSIRVREYICPIEGTPEVCMAIYHGKEFGKLQEKLEFFSEGKQGRNAAEQAEFEAKSKIKKQMDKNYRKTKEELANLSIIAMLAGDYNKIGHRMPYPCYASDKYDGVRVLAKKQNGVVTLESRTGQPYDVPHITAELSEVMVNGEIFDGEVYLHGYALEEITSAVGRTDPAAEIAKCLRKTLKFCGVSVIDSPEAQEAHDALTAAIEISNLRPKLEFHVFDLPHIEEKFAFKVASIHDLENVFANQPHLCHVDYTTVNDEAEMKLQHTDCVERGYEGIMLRNPEGVYESGKRSAALLKYKTFMDNEFQILAVNPDKDGHAVFTVQNRYADNTFEVTMGSHAERAFQMRNAEELIGKWLNVQFQTLYKKTHLPQFPTGKCLRACNDKGETLE